MTNRTSGPRPRPIEESVARRFDPRVDPPSVLPPPSGPKVESVAREQELQAVREELARATARITDLERELTNERERAEADRADAQQRYAELEVAITDCDGKLEAQVAIAKNAQRRIEELQSALSRVLDAERNLANAKQTAERLLSDPPQATA